MRNTTRFCLWMLWMFAGVLFLTLPPASFWPWLWVWVEVPLALAILLGSLWFWVAWIADYCRILPGNRDEDGKYRMVSPWTAMKKTIVMLYKGWDSRLEPK